MTTKEGDSTEYVKVFTGRRVVDDDDDEGSNEIRKMTSSEGDRLLEAEATVVRVRRRRCLCTLVLIVIAVSAAAGVGAYFVQKSVSNKKSLKQPFTFEDVFSGTFSPRSFSASWMPKSSRLTRLFNNGSTVAIEILDGAGAASKESLEPVLFCVLPEIVSNESVAGVMLSHDERYVLVTVNQSGVYRHSRLAQYAVVQVDPADPYNSELLGWLHGGAVLRYATWGQASNALFFVTAGNSQIFGVPDVLNPDTAGNLSAEGINEELFYGIPDWLYEEEIFASDHAMWLSPDDSHLAYTSINETGVRSFEWTVFGDPSDAYVNQKSIRYPKAGSPNPSVKLHVTPTSSAVLSNLLVPSQLVDMEHYVMQVRWLTESLVCALWMDRLQQKAVFAVYNVNESVSSDISPSSTNSINTDTWVENYPMYSSIDNGAAIIVRMPRNDSKQFVHLAILRVPADGGAMHVEYLTSGSWEVTRIVYVAADHVAFEATIAGRHMRQVYKTSVTASNMVDPTCITCAASAAHGDSCGYNSFSFNKDRSYILQQCLGPGTPLSLLLEIQTNGSARTALVLEDNQWLVNQTQNIFIPKPEFFTIEANGVKMPAMRWAPDDSNSKRPTLFYAYNGPLSYSVDAIYPLYGTRGRWHTSLIGKYGFQIIVVDGRGTGYLGDVYGKAQYRQLGIVETEDQIAAARYAVQNLSADASKLAFWGWSYGGYMASMLASSGTGVYGACVAVAPVTDWRYYDTAYTERFMRLPTAEDNLANYEKTSVLSRVGTFNSTRFFLIHGTADDNVHFQNTAQFVKALVEQEVDFRLQFYTDKAHSLAGSHTQLHLYRSIEQFIRTALKMV